jgi:hypothetical protein
VTSKKINIYCEQHDVFGCSLFLLSWYQNIYRPLHV